MKTKSKFLTILCAAILFCSTYNFISAQGTENSQITELVILHTNDHHGAIESKDNLGGLAERASYINSIRQQNKNVLLLDAGDINTGTAVSNMFKAEPDILAYNLMGYDACVFGNHEFDNGKTVIEKQIELANFPFISANVVKEKGDYLDSAYIIKEFDGVRVGVFGLTTRRTTTIARPDKSFKFLDEIKTAKKMVLFLRDKKKVDTVILLGHLGSEEEAKNQNTSIKVAQSVSGIDFIIDGHSHTKMDVPFVVNSPDGKEVKILSAWEHGKTIGKVDLKIQNKKIIEFNWTPVQIQKEQFTQDVQVVKLIEPYLQKASKQLDNVIATSTEEFVFGDRLSRYKEIALGDLTCDGLMWYAKEKLNQNIDFAFINGGSIRNCLPKGNITERDITTVLPFDNWIYIVSMKGSDVIELFKFIGSIPQGAGAFAQVSKDVRYTITCDKDGKNGKISNVTICGKEINPKKVYRIATNDYIVSGGDGYEVLKKSFDYFNTSCVIRDAIIEYVKQQTKPLEPTTDGRINIVNTETELLENQKSVDVIFMHDIHSCLDRMAKAKTLIDEQNAKNPDTFIFDAGDFSMGTLYQTIFETQASELCLLGNVGVDASTLGNHEFDFGADGLKNMLDAAFSKDVNLPKMVLCNVDFSAQNEYTKIIFPTFKKYFKDYAVIQKGDVKIAVIGVFGKDALFCAPTCKITFIDPIVAVKNTVEKIKQTEKVDMIVCLSHGGTDSNIKKSEDEILAKNVPELDLIISGHTHTLLKEPKKVGNTIIASCGEYSNFLGNLSLQKNNDNRWSLTNYKLTSLDDKIQNNKQIDLLLEKYSSDIDNEYLSKFNLTRNQVLTESSYDLKVYDEVGYLMASAMAQTVSELEVDGDKNVVDFVVVPSGTLRGTYKKGDVTVDDVFTSFSLGIGPDKIIGYPLVSVYLTGKELKAAAELDCSLSPLMAYVRLYMDKFSYDYNPNRLIFDKVTDVYSLDQNDERHKIQDEKTYKVVADLYTANMLGGILKTTKGLVSIIPKDKDGKLIADFTNQIIYIKNSNGEKIELKAWYAIAYALSKSDNLGNWTTSRSKAAVAKPSINPIKYFSNPSKIAIILYVVILFVILLIFVITMLVIKRVKKNNKIKNLSNRDL